MEMLEMLRSFVCCCHRSQEGKLCSKWEVLLFAAGTIQDFPACRGGEGSAPIPVSGFPLCPWFLPSLAGAGVVWGVRELTCYKK